MRAFKKILILKKKIDLSVRYEGTLLDLRREEDRILKNIDLCNNIDLCCQEH